MYAARLLQRWSLYLIVGLAPLVTGNLTAFGASRPLTAHVFGLPRLTVLAVLAAAGLTSLAVEVIGGTRALRWHPSGWLAVAFVGLCALSAAASPAPAIAWLGQLDDVQGVLGCTILAAVWLLALNVADTSSELRRVAVAAAAGGALVTAYAAIQLAGVDPVTWGQLPFEAGRAFATFGNPDPLAGYLVLPLALAPALALTEERAWLRVAWWVLGAACLALVVWSTVRGAWIAAVVAVAGAALQVRAVRGSLVRVDRWALFGAAAVLGVVVIAGVTVGTAGTTLQERVAAAFETGSGSVATRLSAWRAAVAAVGEAPLLGTGPDTFRIAWYRHRPVADIAVGGFAGVSSEAHSQPLQLAATVGIPAALVWLVFVGVAAFSGVRTARSLPPPGGAVVAGWATAALAGLAYLATGVADVASSGVLWVALACCVAPRAHAVGRRGDGEPTVGAVAAVGPTTAVLVAATAVLAAGILATWIGVDARLAAARDGDTEAAIALTESWIGSGHPTYLLASADLLRDDALALRASGAPIGDFLAAVDLASEAYATASLAAPWEHDIAVRWSSLLNEAGPEDASYYRGALEVATQGVDAYPVSLACRVQAAVALYGLERYDEAADRLDEAWAWDPGTLEPARIFAEAALAADDPRRAREAIESLKSAADPAPYADLIARWETATGE